MIFKLKLKAFLWHFFFSGLIALAIAFVSLVYWFPAPYWEAVGPEKIFFTILLVDVVIGPFLTFVVFNPAKKSLKIDLAIIFLIQFIALVVGVFSLWMARPVHVVGLGHRFDLIRANDVVEAPLPWAGVRVVGIKRPDDPKVREKMLFEALAGRDYGSFPEFYQPLGEMREELIANSKPISELKRLNPEKRHEIDDWLKANNYSEESVIYQGLRSPSKDMAVLLDLETAKFLAVLPLVPWEN